jgi:hypothetical protein
LGLLQAKVALLVVKNETPLIISKF